MGDALVKLNGEDMFRYVTLARWACIPFSLLGAIICYRWSSLLFGEAAGVTACVLWCFSPTVLGNGSLLTPDATATSVGLAACYTLFRWLTAPSWRQCVLAGVVLGAAEATKSTWIILFALYPLIWLVFRLGFARNRARPAVTQLAAILALGWWLLVSIYGWQGVGARMGTLQLRSDLFRRVLGEPTGDGEYRVRPALANVPLPFPRDYVLGLDRQRRDLEGPNRSFLRGEWRDEGWWHYYAYGLAVKEPVGALALAALSLAWWCAIACRRAWRAAFSNRRLHLLAVSVLVALCPLVVFVVASASTGMNHHVRYVMPVVPYLYILGSGLLTRAGPWCSGRMVAGGVLTAAAVLSSLLAFPHSGSYFNELVGGPAGGIRCLNNSNIDWGQDLLLLAQWKRQHLPNEPIHLAYFGRVNPTYAGIEYQLPPLLPRNASVDERRTIIEGLSPGWYAVSATLLQGRAYFVESPDGERVLAPESAFSYFQELVPSDRIGYSIFIYHVPSRDLP